PNFKLKKVITSLPMNKPSRHAKNACERRLLRSVLPFHSRTSRHHQGRSEAFGEHHCVRSGAHRRPSNDVRLAAPAGRAAGGRYEEPQHLFPARVHPPSARSAVSDSSPGGGDGPEIQEALSSTPALRTRPLTHIADTDA